MASQKNSKTQSEDYGMTIGKNLNFSAAEAYKLLRTNLEFSLPDANGCKVIGITSTLRGEGKSTTSANIAYTIAQTGKKVLLLEADLRLPTAAKRMGLNKAPGLSNLLAGQSNGSECIQSSPMLKNLKIITAGDVPPNPAELLGSEQMGVTIRVLSESFDMIIIDLPPVSVVSDALIMSKLVSGMVVVVRQSACSRRELDDTMRQLKFTDCKILGFVMTDSKLQEKRYYKKGRKRYGNYSSYGGSAYGYYRQEDQDEKA